MVKMQQEINKKKFKTTSSDEDEGEDQIEDEQVVKKTQDEINGSFDRFNLPEELVNKLKTKGFKHLLPIQVSSLEIIRNGNDIIAQSRTGTGKTMAFAIPLVEKLIQNKTLKETDKSPKILVLAPTRELAKQVGDDFKSIVPSHLKTVCVYGGVSYEKQHNEINRGVHIVAGTPGRLLDLIQSQTLKLNSIDYVVLDEVDRMLDMGFQESVEEILNNIYLKERSTKPQTLLFSATCPPWVKYNAKKYLNEDKLKFIDLIGDSKLKAATTVEYLSIQSSYHDRASIIGSLLQVHSGKHGRAIIFCETKKDADELACSQDIKLESHVLHGDVPQDKRELVLKHFRLGKYRVLISTDVAARGLDIPEVDLVICCSPTRDHESFIHRSGRTGRAGRTGVCICFFKPQESNALLQLERKTGIKFKRIKAPTPNEIVEASANDAARALDTVDDDLINRFRKSAENIIKVNGKDPIEALAAALAVISGCTKVTKRSLLTNKENYTTYHLYKTDNDDIRGKSFAFVIMKKILPEQVVEQQMTRVTFTKDKRGLVFDIPSEYDELIQSKGFSTRGLELKEIDNDLPELDVDSQSFASNNNSRGGGDRGRFGGRGGSGGRGGNRGNGNFGNRGNGNYSRGGFSKSNGYSNGANGSGSGGFKRKSNDFDTASSFNNKKIKFDE